MPPKELILRRFSAAEKPLDQENHVLERCAGTRRHRTALQRPDISGSYTTADSRHAFGGVFCPFLVPQTKNIREATPKLSRACQKELAGARPNVYHECV